jgi:cytochrome P450
MIWYMACGDTLHWMGRLHAKYSPVVRISQNELSFVEAQAWKDIYGFQPAGKASNQKDPKFYELTSVDVPHMVNANDEDHARARRVFSNTFSDKALKLQEPLLSKYVDLMVEKWDEKVAAKGNINLVEIFNFTTFDIMSMHSSTLLAICSLLVTGDLTFGEPLHLLQISKYKPWVAMVFTGLKAMNMLQVI